MHPLVHTIVVSKLATLKELRDDYSIEEAILLYDSYLTSLYNKYQVSNIKGGKS